MRIKKSDPGDYDWGWMEERDETHNEWILFKQSVERAAKEVGVTVSELVGLMNTTYGEWHWHGILSMPWRHFLRDLKRTKRLEAEVRVESMGWTQGPISEEEALEEGLTIIDDPTLGEGEDDGGDDGN